MSLQDDFGGDYFAGRQTASLEGGAGARLLRRLEEAEPKTEKPQRKTPPAIPPPVDDNGGLVETAGAVAKDVAGGVVEAPRQVLGGFRDALEEGTNSVAGALDFLSSDRVPSWLKTLYSMGSPYGPIRSADRDAMTAILGKDPFEAARGDKLPTVGEPTTATGGVVRSVTQFVTSLIPGMRAAKIAGVPTRVGQAAAGGATADAFGFDPHEERVSNIVQRYPAIRNPITAYLAAAPDDSEAEGRFKNALEGVGLGMAADGLMFSLRAIKSTKRLEAEDAVRKATAETAAGEAVEEVGQRDFLLVGDPAQPLVRVTPQIEEAAGAMQRQLYDPPDPMEAFAMASAGETVEIPAKAININLARLETADDVKLAIAETGKLFSGQIDEARRGTISNETTAQLADELGMTPAQLLSRRQGQAFNAEEALAARRILASSAEQLVALARKAQGVDASEADIFAFRKALALHSGIQSQVSGLTAEAGRALQAFRIAAKGGNEQARAIREMLHEAGGADFSRAMAERIALLDSVQGVNKAARSMEGATSLQMLEEAWINGLLSGPTTHAVNALSNSMTAVWAIGERALGAQVGRPLGGEGVARGEATAMAFGMVEGAKDGLVLFAKALRTGEGSDLLGKVELPRRSISAANVRETALGRGVRRVAPTTLDEGGVMAYAVDLLGEAVRVPGRVLTAGDEFFKSVAYRAELHAQAFRQATAEGLEGPQLAARVRELAEHPTEAVRMQAADFARYQTFTKELGPTGRSIQQAVSKTPGARFVAPFIRTPANIMKYAFERTPLAPLSGRIREDIAAGGARRDMALARIGLGSTVMMVTADLAMQGHITGGGPADPELKAAMRRQGWQPYSVKLGDTYYSYNRLDPLGMLLGISADMAEISGQVDEVEAGKLVAAAAVAFSQNVTSKTWMSGPAELVEAVQDPRRYGERYLARFAGSFIPTLSASIERSITDPTVRETEPGAAPSADPKARASSAASFVQRMVNEARGRIPGYSESLPPRRNLWGEPIVLSGGLGPDIASPIYQSREVDSPVDREIVRNRIPVSMPTRQIDGVELTSQEYDLYIRLAGNELKVGGRGLRETLNELVQSDLYQRQSDGAEGGKALMIRGQVQAYRQAAQAQVKRQSPELVAAIRAQKLDAAEARRPQR